MHHFNTIQSEAYRAADELRGMTHVSAADVFAVAYNQTPAAVEFYEFTRTLQAYQTIISENTTLMLSTDSDLFKFLKGMQPDSPAGTGADLR